MKAAAPVCNIVEQNQYVRLFSSTIILLLMNKPF